MKLYLTIIIISLLFTSLYALRWPPPFRILDKPEPLVLLRFYSGGDEVFIHKILALALQNAGDSFSRYTALKHYDYANLYHWLTTLDELDPRSNILPAAASYYFSQTQLVENTRYIINYLEQHAKYNLEAKWWWLYQAAYLAQFKLKDYTLSCRLASQLAAIKGNLPIWTKQLIAFFYEQLGEEALAYMVIEDLLKNPQNYSPQEINFMQNFLEVRVSPK